MNMLAGLKNQEDSRKVDSVGPPGEAGAKYIILLWEGLRAKRQ